MFRQNYVSDYVKNLIAYTCWYIWKGRCEVKLGKKKLDIGSLVNSASHAVAELAQLELSKGRNGETGYEIRWEFRNGSPQVQGRLR